MLSCYRGNLPPESVPEFVKRRWRVQRSIFAPPIKDAVRGILRHRPARAFLLAVAAGRSSTSWRRSAFATTMPTTTADIQKLLRLRNRTVRRRSSPPRKMQSTWENSCDELEPYTSCRCVWSCEDADAAIERDSGSRELRSAKNIPAMHETIKELTRAPLLRMTPGICN